MYNVHTYIYTLDECGGVGGGGGSTLHRVGSIVSCSPCTGTGPQVKPGIG